MQTQTPKGNKNKCNNLLSMAKIVEIENYPYYILIFEILFYNYNKILQLQQKSTKQEKSIKINNNKMIEYNILHGRFEYLENY